MLWVEFYYNYAENGWISSGQGFSVFIGTLIGQMRRFIGSLKIARSLPVVFPIHGSAWCLIWM